MTLISSILGPAKSTDITNADYILLDDIFSELSSKEQACFEYCYLNNKTHREIAQLLDLPQDTVSTIIRRTKEKLKNRLKQIGFENF